MGHTSTVSYTAEAARVVFQETGLLPHINAGTLQQSQLMDLRRWSASQVCGTDFTTTTVAAAWVRVAFVT
jgi:hypothetical protein